MYLSLLTTCFTSATLGSNPRVARKEDDEGVVYIVRLLSARVPLFSPAISSLKVGRRKAGIMVEVDVCLRDRTIELACAVRRHVVKYLRWLVILRETSLTLVVVLIVSCSHDFLLNTSGKRPLSSSSRLI